ncbi:MAG: hypothetical protein HC869_00445 [Rhodospirillales bacterium]|nr:hypothetical protein [Rhodospirillales bacterium]
MSASAWLAAALLPQPYVPVALAIAVIWTLKVVAPILGNWSRRAEGAVADIFYVVGFLLPHAPSLALALVFDIPAGFGPATIAAPFFGFLLFLSSIGKRSASCTTQA